MTRYALVSFFVFASSLFIAPAWSQDKGKIAYTDPAEADADFAYQGEFTNRGWGLQVVAQGDGKFIGVLYRGGLPGAGWDRQTSTKLEGKLTDDAVLLEGEDTNVSVHRSYADLLDGNGRIFVRLARWIRVSSTLGLRAPHKAEVLFNGTDAEQFTNGKLTDDGLLRMGASTKAKVGDFRLHLEFRTPYMPHARGQGRANSGVYIQQRYEVQILDSFGLEGVENECAGLYKQQRPAVNMALPPLTWQTYDIWFQQPRWSDDGKTKVEPAMITVLHNGVPVHWFHAIENKTGGGKPEGPEEFPIALQDHGNPVVFRNVWMVPGQGLYPLNVARASTPRGSTNRTTSVQRSSVTTPVCCSPRRVPRLLRRCR